jgi:hypothetical protein
LSEDFGDSTRGGGFGVLQGANQLLFVIGVVEGAEVGAAARTNGDRSDLSPATGTQVSHLESPLAFRLGNDTDAS